jgi:hypothetical protein
MVAYFFLGIVVLAVLLLLIKSVAAVDAAMLARLVKGFAIVILIAGVAYVVVAGRAGLVAAALPIAVPILLLWLRRRRSLAGAGGPWDAGTRPSGGGRSDVETAYFAMTLDHASGRLDGWIKKSKFAGRRLSELARNELLELRREVSGDSDSVSVLEAFLDRAHGPDWRGAGSARGDQAGSNAGAGGAGGSSSAMTRDEAYEVLGLKPGAQESEIRDAHHRLMKKLHPDQGGSDYLAARVNRARDVLLGT